VASAGMIIGENIRRQAADAQLRCAVFWRNYSEGPVSELHRSCAADIARAALRLWSRNIVAA